MKTLKLIVSLSVIGQFLIRRLNIINKVSCRVLVVPDVNFFSPQTGSTVSNVFVLFSICADEHHDHDDDDDDDGQQIRRHHCNKHIM